MNRILLLGGSGILGSEVLRNLNLEDMDYIAPLSSELDVRNKVSLQRFAHDFKPNWIINCTAWTNVDGAEDSFESALSLNETAVRNIAEVAKQINCRVIHVSTDYVFDGTSPEPYDESAQVKPLNKYGESKLRGEGELLKIMPEGAYIIRTSWLYGKSGKNFVKTIAAKAVRNESAQVVDDQIGSPTSARDLARAIISITDSPPKPGIYNFSNKGICSWFELACTIYRGVGADPKLVEAIDSSSLGLKAKRPKYSLLSKDKWESTGLSEISEWKISLESILPEILTEIQLSEPRCL
jgi:dTDP-4-dehydrorhamnose reductase